MDKIRIAEKALPDLMRALENCDLCVRKCGVNRLNGEKGFCASGPEPVVYSCDPHHGEEPPISGSSGSGTIFFSRCGMECVYCQNFRFSQADVGREVSAEELARMMLELQDAGCHNINLVSPTHIVPAIVESLKYACADGLEMPVVYNTGGYDSFHVIRALEGLIDVYLPDMKYASDDMAVKYSSAPGYVENNRRIVKEMYRQVGSLKIAGGAALKGLIVRLLVLPNGISGTEDTLAFLAEEIGPEVFLSVMSQYYPAYKAGEYRELSRRVRKEEFRAVVSRMHELGLENGWVQSLSGGFDEDLAGENLPPTF